MTGYQSKKKVALDRDAEIERLNEKIEFLSRTNMLYSDWEHRETQVTSDLIRKGIEEAKINTELRAEIAELKAQLAQPAQEPVAWGVDWGKVGDIPCASIIKRLPNGGIKVMAVEYAPYSYTTPPQPAQEPMAYCYVQKGTSVDILTFDDEVKDAVEGTLFPLYTHPQRPWVGLTDKEVQLIYGMGQTPTGMMKMVEAKLKEKNT